MIKHIVCFKLKNPTPELCRQVREKILSMNGKVDLIRGLEVGVDFLHSDRSYDVALSVLLDSPEALNAYQADPYHSGVVKAYMAELTQSSISVDFALD